MIATSWNGLDASRGVGTLQSGFPGLPGLSRRQWLTKRTFDVICATGGLLVLGWSIPIMALFAWRSTGRSGIFRQTRVGLYGKHFEIRKLRTMRTSSSIDTTITTSADPRITPFGRFLRRTKLDELPQLWNVLRGEMSLVGPRPDVPEFVQTDGERATLILSVPPGITGPSTLVFRNEEALLAAQPDPDSYNRLVLLPTKARINERYVRTWQLRTDVRYILMTLRRASMSVKEAMR